MNSIIDLLKKKNFFICEHGATPAEIEEAQKALNLAFADDYRTYLRECGTASYEGHELTGIGRDINLDVVKATVNNLKKNPKVNLPLYVVEETHIDGIVIWQAPDGQVYQTNMESEPFKIAENLSEYIQLSDDLEQ